MCSSSNKAERIEHALLLSFCLFFIAPQFARGDFEEVRVLHTVPVQIETCRLPTEQAKAPSPGVTIREIMGTSGALAGGMLGNQVGSGAGKTAAAAAGTAAGGYAGNTLAQESGKPQAAAPNSGITAPNLGANAGSLAGGAIGGQVGSGSGKALATEAGKIAGEYAGNKAVEQLPKPKAEQTRDERPKSEPLVAEKPKSGQSKAECTLATRYRVFYSRPSGLQGDFLMSTVPLGATLTVDFCGEKLC